MADREACISKTGFWVLIGSIWAIGLLGIIISSIAINNAKTLKDMKPNEKTSTGFLVVMLIVFILIICGASVYGFALFRSPKGLPTGAENYLKSRRSALSDAYKAIRAPSTSTSADVEMGDLSRQYQTHHQCSHHQNK